MNKVNKQFCFAARWLPFACIFLLVGCAGTAPNSAENATEERVEGAIVIHDEVSVDSSLRREFETATALLSEQKYEEGIELLEKVITRSPNSTAPYINMAIAYRELGKPQEAEKQFEKVLAISPSHPVANNEYGLVLRRLGKFTEARTIYENLLAEHPDFHPARKNLGILCDIYIGDLSCALEQYKIYSKARPDEEKVKLWIVDLERRQ